MNYPPRNNLYPNTPPQPGYPQQAQQARPFIYAQRPRTQRHGLGFWMLIVGLMVGITAFATVITVIGAALLFLSSGRILPNVSAAGVNLGGMSPAEVETALSGIDRYTVNVDGLPYDFSLAALGLQIDSTRTAQTAAAMGRTQGSFLNMLFRGENIAPALRLRDPALAATTDANQLLEQVAGRLRLPLQLNVYDPVQDDAHNWILTPAQVAAVLSIAPSDNGLMLSADATQVDQLLKATPEDLTAWLGQNFIVAERNIGAIRGAVEGGGTAVNIQVMHPDRAYVVQSGDTLGGLAWQFGIPYWKIQAANPDQNLSALSAGQTITLPSQDVNLPLPPVFGKRIVISIPQQKMTVYENGAVKWEWDASTGIADSPTTPGLYQVTSHDGTAYASIWNLTMPSFMSIYESVPGFFNGIHGFPSRNGSQILWTNALGGRVTFGCILLSSKNAAILYDWAEDGVIVDIQG